MAALLSVLESAQRAGSSTATLCAVSRAPIEELQAYKRRMGWSFPWPSSFGSDFNYDFNTSVTEEQQRGGIVEYDFRTSDARPPPQG